MTTADDNRAWDPAQLRPERSTDVDTLVDAAVSRAHQWLHETAEVDAQDEGTQQLAALLQDKKGVEFTMDFVDRVMRPEDDAVAAKALRTTARGVDASFLGTINALLVGAGAFVGPILPSIVMPLARMRLRQLVGHLVLDADSDSLDKLLDRAAERGEQLNLNLLGEAVLGEEEARRRTELTLGLINNPKVTYVSVKASSMVAQLNPWDIPGSVERLKERLRPLYHAARNRNPRVFINMDMEEYHDLHLTIKLFTELLNEPELRDLEAGIVLQAYLPDTLHALEQLARFATERVAAGGAKIKIRLVKGANLSMEKVQAEVHSWHQAPYLSKSDVDANYYRLLDYILQPEFAHAVRIGVASHNLFTVALAWELAHSRGVTDMVDSEMLQGMAPGQQAAVRKVFGDQILYTPVVHKDDFDVAVSYLVRRLEENAAEQNFLHALFAPKTPGDDPIDKQEDVFRTSVAKRWDVFAGAHRIADGHQWRPTHRAGFHNEPDTDPALELNRTWVDDALEQKPQTKEVFKVTDSASVDSYVETAVIHGKKWAEVPASRRAELLAAVAEELRARRPEFISVMAHEANKTVTQSDPEVSEAIDFAEYYGQSALTVDAHQAEFTPNTVTVVAPPWNFPVAIPTGGVTSALAAGSAVILKPAPQVVQCATRIVEAIHAALDRQGLPQELVQLVATDEADAGKRLISHPDVDAVILTGASQTAELFRSWNPHMTLMAETSGKNALIITPSADPDLAVADLYNSAFGHSGQKCSAASLVILVGAAGESERIRQQLIDATSTLIPGPGTDIRTTMNGLIEEPGEKLLRGLTTLEPGETWLLKPEKLNEEGTLWSPGIRDNVRPGSWYHTHECFGPVLGIMHASTLEEAIEWQNSTGYGLTGGIHSLDDEEIRYWIDHVEVGNAYVNRGITGAVVQRQPFGGWKESVVGPGAKAGGPNYVTQMGTWTDPDELTPVESGSVLPEVNAVLQASEKLLDDANFAWLRQAAHLDQRAWDTEFGRTHDHAGLNSEANIFRYLPFEPGITVLAGDGFQPREVLRELIASLRAGTKVTWVAEGALAAFVQELLNLAGVDATVHDGTPKLARGSRVRTLGSVSEAWYEKAAETGSVILDGPVIAEGRRELLPYLHEQAISVTMHRFGIPRDTAGLRSEGL
ncbi:MAG: bifunctional proline dehydrogenase/L-glutamate gamma-semialdehyde dehydrogenase [Corynebacterium glucuronolyticum]|nr:bifunctional proline dehydrogenase/L-glutamate gamma-semialdehyde dehydrogenase [Corynebacterium glucuronolyticum]